MISAVQFYDVVLFFHILFVVLAFGPTFAYGVFIATAQREDPRSLLGVAKGIQAWDRIGGFLLLGILIAGVYLVADGPWDWGDFYVSWGFVAVIAIGALSGAVFAPRTKELIAMLERETAEAGDGPFKPSAEFEAASARLGQFGALAGIIVILTVYIMTAKPFL